jgi:hypothetical protein
MDVVADAVATCYEDRAEIRGLKMVYEPETLRFFQAQFVPLLQGNTFAPSGQPAVATSSLSSYH